MQTLLQHKRLVVGLSLGAILIALLLAVSVIRHAAPWQATGTLVVAVRPDTGTTESHLAGFGMDNMFLLRPGEKPLRVTLLSRRVRFSDIRGLHVVLESTVPVGAYEGFAFSLSSPESRAQATDGLAPTITLTNERVDLPAPFTVAENEMTAIILGFESESALVGSSTGFNYLPIVQIETRTGATLDDSNTGGTEIRGGTIRESAMYGMAENGLMRRNYRAVQEMKAQELIPVILDDTLPTEELEAPMSEERVATSTDSLPDQNSDTATDTATSASPF